MENSKTALKNGCGRFGSKRVIILIMMISLICIGTFAGRSSREMVVRMGDTLNNEVEQCPVCGEEYLDTLDLDGVTYRTPTHVGVYFEMCCVDGEVYVHVEGPQNWDELHTVER